MSKTIGQRIAEARGAAGLTQEGLARRLQLSGGLAVSRWERDETSPMGRIEPIARELGVSPAWLLGAGDEVVSPETALAPEVLALCDALGVARPTPEEARWLTSAPRYHRATPLSIVDTLRTYRAGLAPEDKAASDEAQERFTNPAVPRKKGR